MRKLVIIGVGAHAKEIEELIDEINELSETPKYEIIGYYDNNSELYEKYDFKAPFCGSDDDIVIQDDLSFVIGVGSATARERISKQLKEAKFETIIHPEAHVSKSAKIGEGCIITRGVGVGPMVKIGSFCLLNGGSIAHDCEVGDYNVFGPKSILCGAVTVGNSNFFGTDCSVIPQIEIGNNNTIEAGMVVTKNIGDDTTVFYRYKEKLFFTKK